ncbi:hypothetical protein GGR40_002159 [Novosphingobium gossypii]
MHTTAAKANRAYATGLPNRSCIKPPCKREEECFDHGLPFTGPERSAWFF